MRWMCHDVSASSRRKEGAVVRRDKGLESDWGREFTGCIQLAKLSPNTSPGICQDVAMSTLCSVSQGTCQAEEPDSETSPLPLPGSGSIHHHFEPLLAFILICLPFYHFWHVLLNCVRFWAMPSWNRSSPDSASHSETWDITWHSICSTLSIAFLVTVARFNKVLGMSRTLLEGKAWNWRKHYPGKAELAASKPHLCSSVRSLRNYPGPSPLPAAVMVPKRRLPPSSQVMLPLWRAHTQGTSLRWPARLLPGLWLSHGQQSQLLSW